MSSSSGALKDGYSGLKITDDETGITYTVLKRRMEISEYKFFYEATTVPIKAKSELASAVVTHTMKIVQFVGPKAAQREEKLGIEFAANRYIHDVGRVLLKPGQNSLCGVIASCAVAYLKVLMNGVSSGIIVYENLHGKDLYDFRADALIDLQNNPGTIRASRFAYVEFVLKMASDLCNIFHKLHTYGIFHNDIKPENTFVGYHESDTTRPIPKSFRLYAIDFGLTCALETDVELAVIPDGVMCTPDDRGFMRYGGTMDFLDPYATPQNAVREKEYGRIDVQPEDAFSIFQLFETYSVGKTISEFLEPTVFEHELDLPVLSVLTRITAEMMAEPRQRKSLAIYSGLFEQILQIAQFNHHTLLGNDVFAVIDQGYDTAEDDSSSSSGSIGRKKKYKEIKISPPRRNNDDDDNS